MKYKTKIFFSICLVLTATASPIFCQQNTEHELLRRADWGARIQPPNGDERGAAIQSVNEESALGKAGIRHEDRIIKVNGELIRDPNRWSDIQYQARAGEELRLLVKRDNDFLNFTVSLPVLPKEGFTGIDVSYEVVYSNYGQKLRAIITRPAGMQEKNPGIFVIQGLSCSSIELYPGQPGSGWTQLLKDLVTKSGMAVMRIEKPGVGDSQGACSELDLKEEMAGYRAGLRYFKHHPWIDPSRVMIFGSSAGSALAPVFANEFDVAGIIADGTFVKTWFEHMLEIERRLQAFQGATPAQIATSMNEGYIPLYYGMLIDKKSYTEVVEERPDLAPYNYHSPRHMYGRSVEYYHQLQDLNIAGAWASLVVPARIRWGTNDWIMSEEDNDMIIEILEKAGHQNHKLVKLEGMDHFNMIHDKAIDSFSGEPGKWEPQISQLIIDWATELVE